MGGVVDAIVDYITDVFDLQVGDLFEYSYIKYIDNC